jgi:hypothetical protein
MGLPGLIFLLVALVLIGIGIAIGLVACLFAALLVGLGIISSSFVIGFRSGRPEAGIRAFLLQCGILSGIPAGAVSAWLGYSFFTTHRDGWPILLSGALGGAIAGVIIALALDFVSRRLHTWASARLLPLSSKAPFGIDHKN